MQTATFACGADPIVGVLLPRGWSRRRTPSPWARPWASFARRCLTPPRPVLARSAPLW